jgi:hypothetical protein
MMALMFKRLSLAFVLLSGTLAAFCGRHAEKSDVPGPWFNGTLLSPVTSVVKAGNIVMQPYLSVLNYTGTFNNGWGRNSSPDFLVVNPYALLVFGLTEWMDIELTPQWFYQQTRGFSFTGPGDLLIGLDFQLIDGTNKPYPSLLLSLEELMPAGKYQRLNPGEFNVDATGLGAWTSEIFLTFYQEYALKCGHFMSVALGFGYAIPSDVHVNDFNSYGGGLGTAGTVSPGNYFTTILSFEYTLTQRWILAFDTEYIHNNRNRFQGTTVAPVGNPSADQINFAPAIEYSFTDRVGIVGGLFFSALGRNTNSFCGGIVTLSYVYPP